MWRRLTRACLVWISLIGLIPAALACAQTMSGRDCCPPGQQMPCDQERAPSSVETAACCATASVAPAAIKATGEHLHIDSAALQAFDASWIALHLFDCAAIRTRRLYQLDPPDIPLDASLTYLQTGRLRL
jgi:hypothetical protein